MKFSSRNPYYRASIVLIGAAVILIILALLTNQQDLTTAAVVLSALTCLITGVFFATLSESDPLDTRYVGLLATQGSINLARISADLGIPGNAVLLPAGKEGRDRTLQFNPVAAYHGGAAGSTSFIAGPGPAGLLTVPLGEPLHLELRKNHQLALPAHPEALPDLIREVCAEVLEVADTLRYEKGEDTITVTMEGYRLIGGCRVAAAESPRCCSTQPCPVCSLVACIIAENLGTPVQVERCTPDPEKPSVTAVYTLLT
jgi:hypothetical protein